MQRPQPYHVLNYQYYLKLVGDTAANWERLRLQALRDGDIEKAACDEMYRTECEDWTAQLLAMVLAAK